MPLYSESAPLKIIESTLCRWHFKAYKMAGTLVLGLKYPSAIWGRYFSPWTEVPPGLMGYRVYGHIGPGTIPWVGSTSVPLHRQSAAAWGVGRRTTKRGALGVVHKLRCAVVTQWRHEYPAMRQLPSTRASKLPHSRVFVTSLRNDCVT